MGAAAAVATTATGAPKAATATPTAAAGRCCASSSTAGDVGRHCCRVCAARLSRRKVIWPLVCCVERLDGMFEEEACEVSSGCEGFQLITSEGVLLVVLR